MKGAAGTITGGGWSGSTGLTLFKHTWVSEATKGLESIVSVTFQPSGAATEVTLRQPESRTMSWDAATRKGGARSSPNSPIGSFPRSHQHRTLNLNSLEEIPCRKG